MYMSNYAMGHCFSPKEIFYNFPTKKLKMTQEQCLEIYSDGNKKDLAASIFSRCFQLIVDDIIENNVYFKLPGVGTTQSYLYMDSIKGDKFKRAFKNGKFRDIDFLESNFRGYQITYEMQSQKRTPRKKYVYLSAKDKQRITNYTNIGKQY